MPEPVDAWWKRRQFTHGVEVPYLPGTYREAWAPYVPLIRQYHPELNQGIVLSQIPPAADVLLLWQCESGHLFVATPTEQRSRPAGRRRKSAWCPECFAQATGRSSGASGTAPARARASTLCPKTPALNPGDAFTSLCAPRPASAAEADLAAGLRSRLEFSEGFNAIRTSRPFFDHLEAWPDIVIPELRIAVEYDTSGRFALEHTGRREASDLRKDRAIRAVRWEVIRIRTGRLAKLGPYDIHCPSVTRAVFAQLLDQFRELRGALIVDSYARS
jgi:hypothetical protein